VAAKKEKSTSKTAAKGIDRTNGKSLESWIWDAACSIRGAKDAPSLILRMGKDNLSVQCGE